MALGAGMPNTLEIAQLRVRLPQSRDLEYQANDISMRIAHRAIGDALAAQLDDLRPTGL